MNPSLPIAGLRRPQQSGSPSKRHRVLLWDEIAINGPPYVGTEQSALFAAQSALTLLCFVQRLPALQRCGIGFVHRFARFLIGLFLRRRPQQGLQRRIIQPLHGRPDHPLAHDAAHVRIFQGVDDGRQISNQRGWCCSGSPKRRIRLEILVEERKDLCITGIPARDLCWYSFPVAI